MRTKTAREYHTSDFQEWWAAYPRKVGKLAAEREYERARKKASAEELLLGIASYLRAKPSYADICHPRTFLSQGRWMDQAPAGRESAPRASWNCQHVTPCTAPSMCEKATFLGKPVKVQAHA